MLDGWIDIDEQEPVINDYVDMWIWDPRWEGAVLASVYVTDGIFRVIDDRTEEIRTFKAKYWRLATAPPLPEVPEVPLPCPFCGSKNLELYEGSEATFSGGDRDTFAVECFHCGARGSRQWREAVAIRAWNRAAEKCKRREVC